MLTLLLCALMCIGFGVVLLSPVIVVIGLILIIIKMIVGKRNNSANP